jgi:excisionase family DNA binding protein
VIERLSTQEAARRLGISVATVRRRIATGELHAEQEVRPQGKRWVVLLDERSEASPASAARITRAPPSRDALTVALDEVAFLRQQLEVSQRGEAELRQLLAREQETNRMLRLAQASTAQGTAPGTAHGTSQPMSGAAAVSAQKRGRAVPWWRALWKALQGR